MTDTRSPEQRYEDERNLAYVARKAPRMSPIETWAYEAGARAARAGWTAVRGVPGMEAHERACDRAVELGVHKAWDAGYRGVR